MIKISESKLNEASYVSSDDHLTDCENARSKFKKDYIEIGPLPWMGGPHPGFGITLLPHSVSMTPSKTKDFINALNNALKEVDRLDKKYKGKLLDYDD